MLNQLLTRLPIRLKGERAALTISNAGGLIDEMATLVLAEGSHQLLAKETEAVWAIWPLRCIHPGKAILSVGFGR